MHKVSDAVPYAFEKRVTALLKSRPAIDQWNLWARGLWRAAAPCFAVMTLLTAWSFFAPANRSLDLSQEFENTLLAPMYQEQPTDSAL